MSFTKTQEAGASVEGEVRWGTHAYDIALFSNTASAKAGFGCKRDVVDVHGEKQSKLFSRVSESLIFSMRDCEATLINRKRKQRGKSADKM